MEKRTVIDIINELANPQNIKVFDNSICGKCSKCGECCSAILPICQDELDVMQKYIIENNIKPNLTSLVMESKVQCPYFDGKKCMIYEVRPLICKEFYCNKKPTPEVGRKFLEKEYITVNMWGIAKDIEKQRREMK